MDAFLGSVEGAGMDGTGTDPDEAMGDRPSRILGRRAFLRGGSVSAVGALLAGSGVWRLAGPELVRQHAAPGRQNSVPSPNLTTILRRREDQLRLRFEFYNLRLDKGSGAGPVLLAKDGNKQTQVVVEFLPQHTMEEALYEYDSKTQTDVAKPPGQTNPDPTTNGPLVSPPVGSRVAGVSRLAFTVPPAALPLAYTSAGLLDWSGWVPRVVPVARPTTAVQPIDPAQFPPKLQAPGVLDTSIELPWWLILSPHTQTGWMHSAHAVSHGEDGVTELWHTRLAGRAPGGKLDEEDDARLTVRAVWTRDPSFPDYLAGKEGSAPADGEDFEPVAPLGMPFRTALSPRDRFDLVISTSDYDRAVSGFNYLPEPAHVDRLMLSGLGGWLDVHGTWRAGTGTGESGTSLQSWRHRASGGRDHYVRIVRKGYLFPFGHGASLIKVSERKFTTIGTGAARDPVRRVAYVYQRYFLVIRERVRNYGTPLHRDKGRGFAFQRLRFTTLVTPNLDKPTGMPGFGNTMAFVPTVADAPLRFNAVATDHAGRRVDLATAVVFVDTTVAFNSDQMTKLHGAYRNLEVDGPVRQVALDGATVAVAEPGEFAGDTSLEMRTLTWGVEAPVDTATDAELRAADQPRFVPTMAQAAIRLAAAEVAIGGPLGSPPVVKFDDSYVAAGFPGCPGEVFVRLLDTGNPAGLDFGGQSAGDRSGGVITPNIAITALSRRTGTVGGDPDTFQHAGFDPADFFGALDATLLGDIRLQDVVAPLTKGAFDLSDPQARDRVVQLTTRDEPEAVITELRWFPKLTNVGDLFVAALGSKAATLDLRASIATPKANPDAATFAILGDLRNFQLRLLPGANFIVLEFNRLRFQTETGRKPDVDVEIREVLFDGPLKFVNQLKDYLSFDAGGFAITVKPTHLEAGFQLPIPSIMVGVFSLQNISFTAGLTIPFTGAPVRTRFGLCTLDNPFLLTVMVFGGGGFFELGLGADGVESFQASLEFGAMVALDLSVASGSVSVTAGIYLAIGIENPPDNPDGAAELTGFLKLKGLVEVMGVVTVSLLMKASVTYIPKTEKAVVRAVVIVEVDVVLFSGSVEIEYEKKWGGSTDPTFGQAIPQPALWNEYCDAFAATGA